MDNNAKRSKMPPPFPSLLGIVLGLIIYWLWPWQVMPYIYATVIGLALIAITVALLRATSQAFHRHETSANPFKESTAIVNTGPFRFTRNPTYVAVAIFQVGIGFLLNNMWILLLTPLSFIAIHYLVVMREETYLESKFGDMYLEYKARVRRWI